MRHFIALGIWPLLLADFGIRLGGASMQLHAGDSTPYLGGYFSDATVVYNEAARAYNEYHQLPEGDPRSSRPITSDDLSMRTPLFQITPTLTTGGDGYFFRIDAPVGIGQDLTTFGLGFYPLNGAFRLGAEQRVALTLSAGAVASWVSLDGAQAGAGGLLQGRLAAGTKVRLSRQTDATFEVGYTVIALGGVVDTARLDELQTYDPRGATPPPSPDRILRGGDQSGMIDASLGVEF